MAAVANIQQAIDDIVLNVGVGDPTVEFPIWLNRVFTEAGWALVAVNNAPFWNKDSADERTVFDWVIPTLRAKRAIDVAGFTPEGNNIAINVVLRTLYAVQTSQNASRITQDQEDTVVAAYNAAF